MRILRIRLAHYRGIEALDVQFRRDGITVVTGPNEAGKSSLAEAVRLLFDHLDSTTKAEVRAVKPVHRDAGPEIEVEMETGPYAFRYAKRFVKRPMTELSVMRPRQENLTGREAHERAAAILAETMDFDLWRALLVEQGRSFEQADLSRQQALTKALDRAAGGAPADPRAESVFDLAREECALYYTERGAENRRLKEAREAVDREEKGVRECREGLVQIEGDVAAAARVAEEQGRLDRTIAELTERVNANDRREKQLHDLEEASERARLAHESRLKSREAAERDVADRAKLADAATRTREELARATSAWEDRRPEVRAAEDALAAAEAAARAAEERRRRAGQLAELKRRDLEHLRGCLDLEQLSERKGRVDRARADAALAREVLARNPVDDACLARVEQAERVVLTADAKLSAGAPSVELSALAPVRLESAGQVREIPAAARENIAVPDRLRIVAPGTVEMEVVAGASISGLKKDLGAARDKLSAACAAARIDGPGRAREAHRERQDAERALAALDQVEKENLRDLRYEDLEAKVLGLSKYLPTYPARRPEGSPPLPATFDDARREEREAKASLEAADAGADEAGKALASARAARDRRQVEAGEREVARRAAAQACERAEEDLRAAREKRTDADLEGALAAAADAMARAAEDLAVTREALRRMDPEKLRELARTDAESLDVARRRREESGRAGAEIRDRLTSLGEAGLSERLAQAEAEGARARQARDDLLGRAAAARLLLETLSAHRDAVRKTYLGPLRDRIESLGRLLFEEGFSVEVGEELEIVSRTRRGVTVPFADLSTGTREQLSLITRIACASLVAEEGGPLLLDDVLGHTDPERLAAMGAVLRVGGRGCQIVLFTSVPERYAHVGDSTLVRLAGLPAPGGQDA